MNTVTRTGTQPRQEHRGSGAYPGIVAAVAEAARSG